jgi:hypothetical protein
MDTMSKEVIYKGCKFRSRLEARWAIFFDEMNFDWVYFLPKNDSYSPDFYLPERNSFIEISEQIPSQNDLNIYDDFAEKALKEKDSFRLIVGDIPRATSDFGATRHLVKDELKKPINQVELNQIRNKIKGIQAFKLMPEQNGILFFGNWAQRPQLATKLFKTVWVMGNHKKVDEALIKARKVRF